MNQSLDQRIVTAIRALCASDEVARRLFDLFAERQRDQRETTVDRASWLIGAGYYPVVAVFKRLEEIGVGRFIAGRHGNSSRMEWKFSIRSLGAVAKGEGRKLEGVSADAEVDDSGPEDEKLGLIDHEFPLRPGLKVTLQLPEDLTDKESSRLSAFLATLVMG
jgi:hypothetical protein